MNFMEIRPGETVEGHQIEAFKNIEKSSKYIYFMAGVHGDEVEGVYVLKKIIEWLEQEEAEFPLITIPIVNIDGYKLGQRQNSHGVDLNRNWPTRDWGEKIEDKVKYNPGPTPLSEPENQFLQKLFEKYPPSIIFSFHSWRPMINYNGNCKFIAEFIGNFNNYPLVDDIGYPTPGSLGTYMVEEFKTPVITFECPTLSKEKSLNQIWEENKEGLLELIKSGKLEKITYH